MSSPTSATQTDVDELFLAYQVSRDPAIRERLIVAHVRLVHYVAGRMLGGLHSSVEVQDLVSYGMIGLMSAIERYDPSREVKFATYATYRIKGAINDEMRTQAWEPKTLRAKHRRMLEAVSDMEHALGRAPSEAELASHLGWDLGDLRAVEYGMEVSRVGSIDTAGCDDGEELSLESVLADERILGDLGPQLGEVSDLMAEAMCRLPSNERRVIQMIYVEEMKLKDIARVLGVTDSWISHLHTRAMVSLQRAMSAQF